MYFAHSASSREHWERLRQHLRAVSDRAAAYGTAFGAAEEARLTGLLHAAAPIGDALLVVGPHANDLDRMLLVEHLIDKPMLDVDAAGVSTGEIPDELFEGRRA